MPPRVPWRPWASLRRFPAPSYSHFTTIASSSAEAKASPQAFDATSEAQSAPRRKHHLQKLSEKRRAAKVYRDSFFPLDHSKDERRGKYGLIRQLFDPGSAKPPLPSYPYGEATVYKQSNRGLYGGKRIQYGHQVSEKNKLKSRKRWKVNVQRKLLYSQALGKSIKLRVVPSVLRTIDKVGGLDNYLVGHTPTRIKELGPTGWMLRYRIINTPMIQARFREERKKLGLPEDGIGLIGLEDVKAEAARPNLVSVTPSENVSDVDPYVKRLLISPTATTASAEPETTPI